jgi:hypothetical protein
VVVTGLGIAAAVDATDGRVAWAVRYDRDVVGGIRSARLRKARDTTARESGFLNEPPILALDRCYLAPSDSSKVLCLFDRPRGPRREGVSWTRSRLGEQFTGMAAEQLVGIVPARGSEPPVLVVAGKGGQTEADPPAPVVVGLDALAGTLVWRAVAPGGSGSIPHGRALLTDREVFAPTWDGIAVYEADNGRLLTFLDLQGASTSVRDRLDPEARPWGNLLPAPGHGLVSIGPEGPTLWVPR